MQKVILFDLDGTLTDSGEGIMNCAEMALKKMGIPVPPREEMRSFVGPPLGDSFLKYGVPANQIDEAISIFRSRYIPVGKFENYPYPGISEMLAVLKQRGHKLYVATSKPEATAIEVLEHFNLSKFFDGIYGATFDHSRSSKSDVIKYLIAQSGNPSDMIMIGDTEFDVLGAAAHGIPTIGVSWGYGDIHKMTEAGAIAIVGSPHDLL